MDNNAMDAHARVHSAQKLGSRGGANFGDDSMGKLGSCGRANMGEDDTNTNTAG